MAKKSITADIAKMSFEEALAELENTVRELEDADGGLDSAIIAYSRGAALKKHCEAKLNEARKRVEKITIDQSGETVAEPADLD
ncbi:MAG TPA: exodeoxyribonuclease VII small subunit [Alphaproteobacteria bacterium]|nr:exodeoxyribonuclease VII small subunit [Alphaproteobacteria bacterium]